jgi:hypothetical protein
MGETNRILPFLRPFHIHKSLYRTESWGEGGGGGFFQNGNFKNADPAKIEISEVNVPGNPTGFGK